MTVEERIEAGAYAIFASFSRYSTPFRIKNGVDDEGRQLYRLSTQEETMQFRWRTLPPLVRQRYFEEAKACLRAAGAI